MPIHHQLTFPLLMAIASLGSVLSMLAALNRGQGTRRQWFVPRWSRKRDSFTAIGWRYRTWSVWCGYLFIALVAADQLIG